MPISNIESDKNSFQIFNDDEQILYTPHYWDKELKNGKDGVTGKYILDVCLGDYNLASMVYSLCDWQHPETVLDELINDGEVNHNHPAAIAVYQKHETSRYDLVFKEETDPEPTGTSMTIK